MERTIDRSSDSYQLGLGMYDANGVFPSAWGVKGLSQRDDDLKFLGGPNLRRLIQIWRMLEKCVKFNLQHYNELAKVFSSPQTFQDAATQGEMGFGVKDGDTTFAQCSQCQYHLGNFCEKGQEPKTRCYLCFDIEMDDLDVWREVGSCCVLTQDNFQEVQLRIGERLKRLSSDRRAIPGRIRRLLNLEKGLEDKPLLPPLRLEVVGDVVVFNPNGDDDPCWLRGTTRGLPGNWVLVTGCRRDKPLCSPEVMTIKDAQYLLGNPEYAAIWALSGYRWLKKAYPNMDFDRTRFCQAISELRSII